MAEKEYIEREKLKQAFAADTQSIRGWDVDLFDLLMDEIDEVPVSDVVEVVRCKDCIHYSSNKPKSQLNRSGYCLLNEDVTDDRREETDFCSYGERKDG